MKEGANSLKIDELMISCVNISEDGYDYRGTFFLSCVTDEFSTSALEIDLARFESSIDLIHFIKDHFKIDESLQRIKQSIMDKVIEYSGLSSKDVHGENFNQEPGTSEFSSSLDKA